MNEQEQGMENKQLGVESNSDRQKGLAELEERVRQSQLIYGKKRHKYTFQEDLLMGRITLNDEERSIYFANSDLQGEMELTIGVFKAKFKTLGIEEGQLVELFPEVDFTVGPETRFVIETKRVIKTLRDLGVYEEDLFEQFHDLIPNYYDRSLAWRK
jgi:hypothetical protein